MEVKTINNQVIDTAKLNDIQAELIEKLENSGIRQFAQQNKGYCYVTVGGLGARGFSTFHLPDIDSILHVTSQLSSLIGKMTAGRWTLALIPVDQKPSDNPKDLTGF